MMLETKDLLAGQSFLAVAVTDGQSSPYDAATLQPGRMKDIYNGDKLLMSSS